LDSAIESKKAEIEALDSAIESKKAEIEALDSAIESKSAADHADPIEEQKEVDVAFTCKAFRHKGVEYQSADLEKSVSEGDINALKVISELIDRKSGVIQVTEKAK